jgi:hypothetical protein
MVGLSGVIGNRLESSLAQARKLMKIEKLTTNQLEEEPEQA